MSDEILEIFSDDDIAELQALLDTEGQPKWKTGDWLVSRIDRVTGHTISEYHNGRDAAIRELARKTDGSDQTLRDRYLTSVAFPADKRHDGISWTVHRLFTTYGQPEASERLEQWLATSPPKTTKRSAAEWLAVELGKPIGEGSSSGGDFARSIERSADPSAKAKEIVRSLGDKGREAIAEAVAADERIAAKTAARAMATETGRRAVAKAMTEQGKSASEVLRKATQEAAVAEFAATPEGKKYEQGQKAREAEEVSVKERLSKEGSLSTASLLILLPPLYAGDEFVQVAESVSYRVADEEARDLMREYANRLEALAQFLRDICDGKTPTKLSDDDLAALLG